jgi:hypothetical protein
MFWPVMYAAPSEARNAMVAPISLPVPYRCIGTLRRRSSVAADGRIAVARGNRSVGIAHSGNCPGMKDKIAYKSRRTYPVREILGASLLLDGQAGPTEQVFRADLLKTRRNALSRKPRKLSSYGPVHLSRML